MRVLIFNLLFLSISTLSFAESSKLACICSEYLITKNNITEVQRIYGLTDAQAPTNKASDKCKSHQSELTFHCDAKVLTENLIEKTPKSENFAKSNEAFQF